MRLNFFSSVGPERFFLGAGLLFGLLYFFVVPPFQSPDEFNHFFRAYQIAEGILLPEKLPDRLGGHMPLSIEEFQSTFRFIEFVPEFRFKLSHLAETFNMEIRPEQQIFCDFANTATYSPVSYLPQAIVIAAFRLSGASLGLIYFAGRLFTYLLWLIAIYHSIRTTPVFKWLLAFLALLPTNLYIANSFSADNVTNILTFLWISQVFRLAFTSDSVNNRRLAVLILLAAALPLAKLVYAALIPLVLIIPAKKFNTRKRQILSYLLIGLPAITLALVWAKLVSQLYIPVDAYHPDYIGRATLAPGSSYPAQLSKVLSDVWYFPKVILNSIFNPYQFYLHSYIGAFGTHLYHQLPAPLWIGTYAVILYTTVTSEPKALFSAAQRLVILCTFLISFILLLLTIHLIWDPVGSGYVWLLQGRYLIPLFPLLFILIGERLKVRSINAKWPLFLTTLIINAASIHLIHSIFYKETHAEIIEAYTGFEDTEGESFTTSNPGIKFGDHGNKTSFEKRRGSCSAMLLPNSGNTCGYTFAKVDHKDVIEIEIWHKGPRGVVMLAADNGNCKPYTIKEVGQPSEDAGGWQKIHWWINNTDSCNRSGAYFYVYNPSGDTVYFDDLRIRHKKQCLIEEDD